MIIAILQLINEVLNLYFWVVISAAIYMTLAAFNVLDTRNRIVWTIGDFLYRLTEPALRPIRRVIPLLGNIDLSPLVLLLIIRLLMAATVQFAAVVRTGSVQPLIY